MIALLISFEAVYRILFPVEIAFREALPVAALGLAVNLASAWLLREEPHHHAHTGHEADHPHGAHEHPDQNLRAAYIHVLADAATSVFAIVGLLAGLFFGLNWMDPLMGIVGALVIANWSYGLILSSGRVLLDVTADPGIAQRIQESVESDGDRVTDLHLWQMGPGHIGAIVALVSHAPKSPAQYKERIGKAAELSHLTVEVEGCA